jgi:hypothetical protein
MALTIGFIINLIMLCSQARHLGIYYQGIFYLFRCGTDWARNRIFAWWWEHHVHNIDGSFIVFHGLWHWDKEILLVFRFFLLANYFLLKRLVIINMDFYLFFKQRKWQWKDWMWCTISCCNGQASWNSSHVCWLPRSIMVCQLCITAFCFPSQIY